MDTKVNYVIVGIFVVVLTAGIIISSAWISGGHSTKTYRKYITYIDETVAGLTEKSPVKFNGVDVGYVESISLNPQNPQQVKLLLEIEESTPIDSSTVAYLQTQGVTGYMFVGLKATKPTAAPIEKKPEQPYPVIPSTPSLFFQLDNAVGAISENISSVSSSIKAVFDEENRAALRNILQNFEKITATIQHNEEEIEGILKSANETFKNSAEASKKFPEISNNLNQTLTDARAMVANLSTASEDAKEALADGKQAIAQLSDESLPSAYEIMERLKTVVANLQMLTDELTDNPSILVRGKIAPPSGPGE